MDFLYHPAVPTGKRDEDLIVPDEEGTSRVTMDKERCVRSYKSDAETADASFKAIFLISIGACFLIAICASWYLLMPLTL
jgi:hypothetical protein